MRSFTPSKDYYMKIEKNTLPPNEDKTNKIGLWVSLGVAATTALVVLGLALYTDYQSNEVSDTETIAASDTAPSSIPTSESQAASIAAATSDQQSQGMTAPSDVGDETAAASAASEAAASAPAAASSVSAAPAVHAVETSLPAASSPAHAILAAENAVRAETRVSEENNAVVFHFASGKSDLAANTLEALKNTVEGVKSGKKAVIVSYADAESNATLTKERAFAVRSVLLAAGVPESHIEIKEPASGGSNSRLVRVELQ